LLSRRPEPERIKTVVAKSSFHMSFFRSLVSVFPRAKFVVLHRAPKVFIPFVPSCFCIDKIESDCLWIVLFCVAHREFVL
jgi:hypothetical protein